MPIFRNNLSLLQLAGITSLLNLVLFHFPFFRFVFQNLDYASLNGMLIIASLAVLVFVLNAFIFYIIFFLSGRVGKILLTIFFILNAASAYFIYSYGIIIDEAMIGNVFNTNSEESGSFFSITLVIIILLLGILPSLYFISVRKTNPTWKRFLLTIGAGLLFIATMVFANAPNWLWIDKHSKSLGGLAMPWSYAVNAYLYKLHDFQKNKKEILLPDAKMKDSTKSIVILVIGESARSKNFSLYGYPKNTNPLLSQTKNLYHFNATSCATYTRAGIKCLLEHTNTDELYEILPNYLYRNQVEVIWRTSNWGEPPIHIKNYLDKNTLQKNCKGNECEYDEILLDGLEEQIAASKSNKILVVLHTSTSHGPTYSKKYPARFETFKPVCNSVELKNCTDDELMNAYDNTIVYTDYLLHRVIENLKKFPDYNSCMLFVSDHGESLGENNLYMHGVPKSMAPREQYEIPFLVWLSDNNPRQLKSNKELCQNHVFHSVLNFLGMESPVYDEKMNIFK
jgi:lipid A ethanolaminephosphotransferase